MKRFALAKATDKVACIILAAGEFPYGTIARALLDSAERIVCCDGAAEELCAAGYTPSAIVGDLDSLPERLRHDLATLIHHRPEQDVNDLWKAITYAIEQGEREITILGAFGRREDHSFGNLALAAARMHEIEIRIVGDHGSFDFTDEEASFESFDGQQISLFTLCPQTTISVHGLRYEPPHNHLAALWQGVSNEACGEEFTIKTDGPTIVYRLF